QQNRMRQQQRTQQRMDQDQMRVDQDKPGNASGASLRASRQAIRTAKRTFAYSSTPFIPQPSAFNAKSVLPPEFYSGATGQPGHFSEGFCLRRVQRRRSSW